MTEPTSGSALRTLLLPPLPPQDEHVWLVQVHREVLQVLLGQVPHPEVGHPQAALQLQLHPKLLNIREGGGGGGQGAGGVLAHVALPQEGGGNGCVLNERRLLLLVDFSVRFCFS